MKVDKSRIKFFCRSFDLRLYRLSKGLYESLGYECVRLTDQSADGYFYTMLADKDCDIAINVDEDCFITNPDAVFSLVDYVLEEGISNAGCPDGGGWCPRGGNPIVTNPFFNVFNLKLLREQFSKSAVKSFDYLAHKESMISAYPVHMLYEGRKYDFDHTDYEPYYPFFFWQAFHTKTHYLKSMRHSDAWTTILYNQDGEEMCRHTWLARFYSVPSFLVKYWQPDAGMQKERIDSIIDESYGIRALPKPIFTMKDQVAFLTNKVVRWMIKVPQRVAGWPRKIKRRLKL
jgi:hypothetical protein